MKEWSFQVPVLQTSWQLSSISHWPDWIISHNCSTWWCHQMETFSALLAICAGNSPVTGEFPAQRPVTWSFDVFFDLRRNKPLSKQWWGWWFKMLSCPLWSHCNEKAFSQDFNYEPKHSCEIVPWYQVFGILLPWKPGCLPFHRDSRNFITNYQK